MHFHLEAKPDGGASLDAQGTEASSGLSWEKKL